MGIKIVDVWVIKCKFIRLSRTSQSCTVRMFMYIYLICNAISESEVTGIEFNFTDNIYHFQMCKYMLRSSNIVH